jgi:hypothetical protein
LVQQNCHVLLTFYTICHTTRPCEHFTTQHDHVNILLPHHTTMWTFYHTTRPCEHFTTQHDHVNILTCCFYWVVILINFVTLAKHVIKTPWRWCSAYGIQNIINILMLFIGWCVDNKLSILLTCTPICASRALVSE